MGAKVDHETTKLFNDLDAKITAQETALRKVHAQIEKGATDAILALETQVKELKKTGEQIKAAFLAHEAEIAKNEQSIGEIRGDKK
jgi:CHASE1-domain containing sensor protein